MYNYQLRAFYQFQKQQISGEMLTTNGNYNKAYWMFLIEDIAL